MKIKYVKTLKDGRRHVLIELGATEEPPKVPVFKDAYYKLSYPLDDTIVQGYHIADPQRVAWDAYSQKWVDA